MQHDVRIRWGTGQRPDPSDVREYLIDCAIRCFHTRGVFQTAICDVAALAGTSSRAVLQHFDGRATLLDSVILRDLEQLWVQSLEPLKSQPTHEAYLVEALVYALDYACRNPDGLVAFKPEVRPSAAEFVVSDKDYALHLFNHLRPQLLGRSGTAYTFVDQRLLVICEWFNRLFSSYLIRPSIWTDSTELQRSWIGYLLPAVRPNS